MRPVPEVRTGAIRRGSQGRIPALCVSAVGLGVLLVCLACAQPRTFEIRTRAFHFDPARRVPDFCEEHSYIAERRGLEPGDCRSGGSGQTEMQDLTGIALSGGGLRSATFALGVVQGLEELQTLDRFDYMSSVSGGAYLASWLQTHMGGDVRLMRDDLGYEVWTHDAESLLENHGDHVEHLRTHSRFINRGRFLELGRIVWSYLWRLPINAVLDLGLHYKRSINWFHPIDIYRDRLEHSYFRGFNDMPLEEINGDPRYSPYLIINANLVNNGVPRVGRAGLPDAEKTPKRHHFAFEFTKHFSGSDGLGYVETPGFDRTVRRVIEGEDGEPEAVEVFLDGLDSQPMRLSWALAASGAAFDLEGAAVSQLKTPLVRVALGLIGAPLNLNLGYEARNFARGYDGALGTTWDYVRMLSYQRLTYPFLNTDARWIKITDGGHFENLGVFALVRRGVSCIVAIDATSDGNYRYSDLEKLKERLDEIGLQLSLDSIEEGSGSRESIRTLQVRRGDELISTLLYLKPNMELTEPHLAGPPEAQVEIDKLTGFARANADFPHTSTTRQSYDWETFEAYRILGRRMALTYLPDPGELGACAARSTGS